jgi:hypothetical protein
MAFTITSTCADVTCQECGRETADVLRRMFDGTPALCTACCANRPGRAWMQKSETELDQQLADARAYWQQRKTRPQHFNDDLADADAKRGARMPQVQRSSTRSTSCIPPEPA